MSILNKTAKDLTVKDSIIINAVWIGIIAAPYACVMGYAWIKDKRKNKNNID
jgi:hypothetical protein